MYVPVTHMPLNSTQKPDKLAIRQMMNDKFNSKTTRFACKRLQKISKIFTTFKVFVRLCHSSIFDIFCKRLQAKRVVFELNAFHISIHIIFRRNLYDI
jgi:hypothetical protein